MSRTPYHHTDVDGDRLAVFDAVLPDGTRGINIRTDPNGSTLTESDIPAFLQAIERLTRERE